MQNVKEQNAKDLRRKWKKFLKEQAEKHGRGTKDKRNIQGTTEKMEQHTTA
jgi:hypothetical protein